MISDQREESPPSCCKSYFCHCSCAPDSSLAQLPRLLRLCAVREDGVVRALSSDFEKLLLRLEQGVNAFGCEECDDDEDNALVARAVDEECRMW